MTATIDTIYLDFSNMESAEDGFQQILKALRTELEDLDRQVTSTLSSWEGPAKEAYTTFRSQWHAEAQAMADQLQWLHGVIRTARSNHHNARETNLRNWRGNAR